MKLLLLLVSVITVQTVHGLNFPGEYGGLDLVTSETESQDYAETNIEPTLNIEDPVSKNDAHELFFNQAGYIISRKGESKCKEKDICIIMGGSCVSNAELCKAGRLVPGCKGKNCQCCVPGTLETKMNNLEQMLQIMQANLRNADTKLQNLTDANVELGTEFQTMNRKLTDTNTKLGTEFQTINSKLTDTNTKLGTEFQTFNSKLTDTNTKLGTEFQTMNRKLTDANTKLGTEFQTLKDNLTDANTKLGTEFQTMMDKLTDVGSKLDSLIKSAGCTAGFFKAAGSNQCYKFYKDGQSYEEAKAKCAAEGLVLAEPTNPITLRKYIAENIDGAGPLWLGGRGTGSYIRWDRSGRQISNTDPLWKSNPTRWTSTSHCLLMEANKFNMDSKPTQPYWVSACSRKWRALCEYV